MRLPGAKEGYADYFLMNVGDDALFFSENLHSHILKIVSKRNGST